MVDFVKKNWQFRDIISENELNRIEDGIEEGITKAEQADQKAQQAQQTANQAASDLAAHLNESAQDDAHPGLAEMWSNRIVEMGSNANGEYIRFSNGLQICWRNKTITDVTPTSVTVQGLTNYKASDTWTFPASFINNVVTVIHQADVLGEDYRECSIVGIPSATSIRLWIEALKTFTSWTSWALAIGRWK